MNYDREFQQHDLSSAPAAARPLLTGTQKMFGFIPAPVGRMVAQPAVAAAFVQMNGIWEHTSLTASEREVVVMTVAVENQCSYCVAMHTAMLAREGADAALVDSLRAGATLPDARLNVLATFARAIMRGRGEVSQDVWSAFHAAGYSHATALEVVLGVATYTLSTFANRLTQAPLDAVFEPFRWTSNGRASAIGHQASGKEQSAA
ncbi:MAG: carboxymuconolactone decarboxylase family protein [Polyangia bacterium]